MTVTAPTTTPMTKIMKKKQVRRMHWYLDSKVWKETPLSLLDMLNLEEVGKRYDLHS